MVTPHYRFYDPEERQGGRLAFFAAEAESIYQTVSARTGLSVAEPIAVVLQTPAPSACAARGVAFLGSPRLGIFADDRTSTEQLRMVLAHETAHILHFAAVGGGIPDPTLSEGFANWAVLPYWSAWQGFASFEDATRAYLADGRFVPVDNPPADCTIVSRDVIYNERASFTGYLLDTYGQARFLAGSPTRVRVAHSTLGQIADYEAIYGKSFARLLAEWLTWVRSGATGL